MLQMRNFALTLSKLMHGLFATREKQPINYASSLAICHLQISTIPRAIEYQVNIINLHDPCLAY